MSVRYNQVLGHEFIVPDIVNDSLALLFIVSAAIYYYAFFGVIACDIAIFLKHIASKAFDVKHIDST